MTDIEQKALKLLNEVSLYKCGNVDTAPHKDLCVAFRRAIEQHEAFRQEVSDVVAEYKADQPHIWDHSARCFAQFIIHEPKPDPLLAAMNEVIKTADVVQANADQLRAALDALGFEIREKNDG